MPKQRVAVAAGPSVAHAPDVLDAAEAEGLIEEMLAESQSAPEPGSGERVVQRPDAAMPVASVVGAMSSAGYTFIYDRKTGDRSVANNNAIREKLKQTHPDGSRVFTTRKPAVEPERGKELCWLHPDHPDRARWDAMGLPLCDADHLRNPFEAEQHVKRKHKRAWETIEADRQRREREEDRALQREILKLAGSKPG